MFPSLLHLTDGSSLTGRIREAGIVGAIVPWNDVLHEGPVPAGLNVAALRDMRAGFLASCGWGSRDAIARSFAERDAVVERLRAGVEARSRTVDEIVLWFEHDLYDQLQILQILDRLPIDGGPRLTAVPGDEYLGGQPASRFAELFASRRDVTSSQRIAARDGWDAFRSADPRAIVDALPRVTDLPHLPAALRRHLQQFPSVRDGLSRTEQQTLDALTRGVLLTRDVFTQANHRSEEAVFMGDAAFLMHIRDLLRSAHPLIRVLQAGLQAGRPAAPSSVSHTISLDDELTITDEGRRVLAGEADRITLCGIDRWLGGVHLTGHGPVWRWHEGRGTLVHV